jgi:hypothetical protein
MSWPIQDESRDRLSSGVRFGHKTGMTRGPLAAFVNVSGRKKRDVRSASAACEQTSLFILRYRHESDCYGTPRVCEFRQFAFGPERLTPSIELSGIPRQQTRIIRALGVALDR